MKLKAACFFSLLLSFVAMGQQVRTEVAGIYINYDEDSIKPYTLPDPLVLESGKKVESGEEWFKKRRPEILELFKSEQFGKFPEERKLSFKIYESQALALDGKATRTQLTLFFTQDTTKLKADLLIYVPVSAKKPSPLLLKIGFSPNSLAVDDPEVREGMMWNREGERIPASEGRRFGTFDVEKFISNGIGVATIYYGDIEPDFPNGIKNGIRGHYLKEGANYPAPDEWGTISAWAWGLSHVMDYLETDDNIDSEKVALYGISRLGKTALWAGAIDERYGMVIASCSGEGGAAISRRQYGETIAHMIHPTRYFYQFCGNRAKYAFNPNSSPIDAHMLLSLIAPRPLLLQTGITDGWSDPKGEFVAAKAAEPVYNLLGKKGLGASEWPTAETPVLSDIGYYMHDGGHGSMPSDYDVFIDFIKMHFIKN
ncbi:hypothetical protein J0X14_17350 [Muricauda sp. CAU 1633]|uniref:glucuronyl esterase domain-containing protein n=1 Tax=Allomuricauda sp. CAU 1633 TaxID=2816036 RepID=UPI001A90B0F3|nr:hypothetical protein [Muricauda sp. CAU 1633]MBO0324079.1 hypothetical protein [Muricauda sp. CAU 1633]